MCISRRLLPVKTKSPTGCLLRRVGCSTFHCASTTRSRKRSSPRTRFRQCSESISFSTAPQRTRKSQSTQLALWNCWTEPCHAWAWQAHTPSKRNPCRAGANAARVSALAAYKGFLTPWKDADPDILDLRKKSIHREFIVTNSHETHSCSSQRTRGMLPAP